MPSRRALLAFALLASTPAFAQPPQPDPQAAPAPSSADQRLRALYERVWAWQREQDGRIEGRGPGALADHYPSVTPAAHQARLG